MLTRRTILSGSAAGALSLATHGAIAQAGAYPNRPIRFYCGFPPGGSTDLVARIIAPPLSARFGQPVVIDNRAGAGGVIGVDSVARAAPDGYTMGFGVSGALTSSVTLTKLPYDPTRDITPVSVVVLNPLVLAVAADSGMGSLKEFIAAAKARPDKFAFGTAGPGTAMHLSGELLKQMADFEMAHAPYKGSGPAVTDLLGGHIAAAVLDWSVAKPHVLSGRLRPLAQTGAKRSEVVPDVPTVAEAGVPGYDFPSWFGWLLPAQTPAPIVERVHADLVAVLRDPGVRTQLHDAGIDPWPTDPAEMTARIKREIDVTARLIKRAGIQPTS